MIQNKVSNVYAVLVGVTLLITWLFCGNAFSGPNDLPIHLSAPSAGIDIRTQKVAKILGPIWVFSKFAFFVDMASTADLPGDRVIIIDSPGGEVDAGEEMLALMRQEQAKGVKQICVVTKEAVSMAFNILSHCDVRLALPKAKFMFHNMFYVEAVPCGPDKRCTAKKLRTIADDLEKTEAPYIAQNMKALYMNLKTYEMHSDNQTYWRVQKLLDRGYLHGTARLE